MDEKNRKELKEEIEEKRKCKQILELEIKEIKKEYGRVQTKEEEKKIDERIYELNQTIRKLGREMLVTMDLLDQ